MHPEKLTNKPEIKSSKDFHVEFSNAKIEKFSNFKIKKIFAPITIVKNIKFIRHYKLFYVDKLYAIVV